MEKALSFNNVKFEIVQQNSQPWIRGAQIGAALGYVTDTSRAIRKLYDAHADEFTPSMTQVVKLQTEGGMQDVRIFSLRGCHLLAMFARTPVAKAFRKWVLDILDSMEESAKESASDTITPDQQCTLQNIVKAKVEALPEKERRGGFPQIWSRFNNHFRIAKYNQLPQSRFGEAIAYLMKMGLSTKKLPASDAMGAFAWLEIMERHLTAIHDMLTTKGSVFSMQMTVGSVFADTAYSKNEELLLGAVNDYFNMTATGARMMLAGIEGSRRIKAVHSFR